MKTIYESPNGMVAIRYENDGKEKMNSHEIEITTCPLIYFGRDFEEAGDMAVHMIDALIKELQEARVRIFEMSDRKAGGTANE